MQPAGRAGEEAGAERFWLLAILLLGAALRLLGLRWGLPGPDHVVSFHPDEFRRIDPVLRSLAEGVIDPVYYGYGCLSFDLNYAAARLLALGGASPDAATLYLVARSITAVFGCATLLVVHRLGRRVASARVGLVAALFLALAPGHVEHSKFVTVDVPATFFVALSLLLGLAAAERPSWSSAALAGASAGLAAATKYPTGLVLLAVVAGLLASGAGRASRARLAVLACAAALLAFLAACPFALTDTADFRRDVVFELIRHPRIGHGNLFARTGNGWWFHLTTNLPWVLTWPSLALGLAGLALVRGRRARLVVLGFFAAYLCLICASRVRFLRYTLPLTPVLALSAALALARLEQGLALGPARSRGLSYALLGSAAALPLLASLLVVRGMLAPDPREAAARWMEAHVPAGALVGLKDPPGFALPGLVPVAGRTERDTSQEAARRWFAAQVAAGRARYRFVLLPDWDAAELLRARPEYVLLSEMDWGPELRVGWPPTLAFFAALESGWELIRRFDTFPSGQRRIFGPSYVPQDWLYPFPELRLYQIR